MAWNGSDGKAGSRVPRDRTCTTNAAADGAGLRARRDSRPYRNGLLAGLVIVALGGAAVWWFFGRGDAAPTAPKPTHKTQRITERKPAQVTRVTNEVVAAVTPVAPPPKPAPTGNVTRVRQTVQMRTLPDGTQVPAHVPRFSNGVERALSTLCNPGGMAIPLASALRRFSDAEILRILNSPLVYDKNDDEAMLARKMEMQRLKGEILDYINEGHTVKEAINEADRTIRRNATYMMMMRKSMHDALATGDGEVVRQYVSTLNAKLEARGMKKFEVPKRYRLPDEGTAEGQSAKDYEKK